MKRKVLSLFLILCFTVAIAQDKKASVFTIDGSKITVEEFLNVFNKNNNSKKPPTEAEIREYLDLYIKFKLKVNEAYSKKLDTLPQIINELEMYRNQLAQPYLNDKATTDGLLKEAYERTKKEVRASHILVFCKENASPKDSLAAWNKINNISKRLEKEDFESVASEVSEDPSVNENGGDLGFFSAFKMLYSFENVAYNTAVGKISKPFRTEVGYHILKVEAMRPAYGNIQVAHIMILSKDGMADSVKMDARKRITEIYKQVKNGVDFAELAKKFSEDATSASTGGDLPWFTSGKMVQEFEDAAFAIRNNGDVYEPILTAYGWHIIKRLDYKPIGTFEEMKADLQQKINRDSRSYLNKKVKLEKLKTEYAFKENALGIQKTYKAVDTSLLSGNWVSSKLKKTNEVMFTIGDSTVKSIQFSNYMVDFQSEAIGSDLNSMLKTYYNDFVEMYVFEYENKRLEQKYPDFKSLLREYKEGILLFELSDRMVWSKAVIDTTGLESFYKKNIKDYYWKERTTASYFRTEDARTAKKIYKLVKKGKMSNSDISKKYNEKNPLNVSFAEGTYEAGEMSFIDKIPSKTKSTYKVEDNKFQYIVTIKEILPAEPKKLNEIKGLVTSDYQNYLEAEWVKELRKKYKIQVNEEVVKTLY